jgi:hypothetical protein
MLKSPRTTTSLLSVQRGQAAVEYALVTAILAAVLIFPYDGERAYVWLIYTLEKLNLSLINGLSIYAYPI